MSYTRRQFLKNAVGTLFLSQLETLATVKSQNTLPRRNILLIISDDLGLDTALYGNKTVATPQLERLAQQGTLFTNAYATVSSCSPSRSVMLSGLHGHTNGCYGLAHGIHHQSSFDWVESMPKVLRAMGYRVRLIGKNHVAPEEVYPFESPENKFSGNRAVKEMADAAAMFFQEEDDRPFLLVVGNSDPHKDAEGGFANNQNYTDVDKVVIALDDIEVPPYLSDTAEVRQELADYYQATHRLDQGVGFVLEALEKVGRLEETLVIFTSDNGMPFPGAKTNLYDPGIHLPLLIRSPLQLERGVVNNALVSFVDILPTVLEWVSGETTYELPGRSLLPILEQEMPEDWDEIYASHVFHGITFYYPMRAVRTREFKLIWNLAHQLPYPIASDVVRGATWQAALSTGQLGNKQLETYLQRPEYELFALESDPLELANLAYDPNYQTVFEDLKNRLLTKLQETNDPWLSYSEKAGELHSHDE